MEKRNKIISSKVTEEQYKAVKVYAKDRGITVSDFIIEAVVFYIEPSANGL